MPTIKDSLYFNYDGISCKTFGLLNVSLDSSMFEETLVASREIIETKIRGNDKPLFHGIEESPIEFSLNLAFERGFTDEVIDRVILWLFSDRYKPLFFEDKPNKVYNCQPVGDATIAHNGLKQGYLTITMRCDSSKVSSPMITTNVYDFSTNAGNAQISIKNTGHLKVYPEISIEKVGNGHITITKDGEIFEVRDLANGEKIYINTEKEIIESDIVGMYRYDKVVGDYYDNVLNIGDNIFKIDGTCKIRFRYSLKYRF